LGIGQKSLEKISDEIGAGKISLLSHEGRAVRRYDAGLITPLKFRIECGIAQESVNNLSKLAISKIFLTSARAFFMRIADLSPAILSRSTNSIPNAELSR